MAVGYFVLVGACGSKFSIVNKPSLISRKAIDNGFS
jgi:hypothetical protein